MRHLLQVGADKVVVNTAAVETPDLIHQISNRFGAQCVVVSIDAKKISSSKYEVYTHSGTYPTGIDPVYLAKQSEDLGAGEIMITSIDQDGTMKGYDLHLCLDISESVSIPVIASGGAGNYEHMLQAITIGRVSALAAASIFHFTQQTPLEAKRFLKEKGINVRL